MGIQKEVELPSKVKATYHRIDAIENFKWDENGNGIVELRVSQFLDYIARTKGGEPIARKFEGFKLDPQTTGIFRFILYRGVLCKDEKYYGSENLQDQDKELPNLLKLLLLLTPEEMALVKLALDDIVAAMGVDVEAMRDAYNVNKDAILSSME